MNLVGAALLESAEASLNLLLKTRPMLSERLTSLNGKTFRITLLPSDASLLLRIVSSYVNNGVDQDIKSAVELSVDPNAQADVTLKGEWSALIKLASEPRSVLFGQGVEVDGDIALLQRLQKAMREPGLDWELWLSENLGDLPTAAITQSLGPLAKLFEENRASLTRNLKSYLQEELEALPARVQFEGWAEQVSAAKQRTEQLERRINKLLKADSL